jgi:hypothetical protein
MDHGGGARPRGDATWGQRHGEAGSAVGARGQVMRVTGGRTESLPALVVGAVLADAVPADAVPADAVPADAMPADAVHGPVRLTATPPGRAVFSATPAARPGSPSTSKGDKT